MRFILLLFLSLSFSSFAQTDTINIIAYNLLNFPNGRDDCGTNTVVPNRADTLRKILQYSKPDIFVACEIQTEAGADSILTRSLNVYGASNYAAANFELNNSGSGLHNMLYYNTDKLTLQWQDKIITSSRDINHYVLYVIDPNLGVYFDTTFIEVYMCHLKAGNSSSNAAIRAEQTQLLMDYIALRPSDRNHFVCGDLNVYTSSEQGYQQMITGPVALQDPINSPGNWNNNGSFSEIHTQSTRSSLNYDCGSKGGSDDRFDQILVSQNVMNGSDSLRYLSNSYDAIGNDGNHFNTNLLAGPTNTQYPDSVVRALYYMSDHLPVALKAVVTYPTSNGLALYPVVDGVSCHGFSDGTATIVPNDGQAPYQFQWDANAGSQTTATVTGLAAGAYCVTVTDALGEVDDYCLFVPEPNALSYATFLTPDAGSCSGEAHIVIQGDPNDYTIVWDDPMMQTGPSAFDLCGGTYEVSITDSTGCSTNVEITIQTASLEEQLTEKLRVYPNPSKDFFVIDFSGIEGTYDIQLIDAFGRIVRRIDRLSTDEKVIVNTEAVIAGAYLLKVENEKVSLHKRLIIHP